MSVAPGEKKKLDDNADYYMDRPAGGGYSITVHNYSKTKMITISFTPANAADCFPLGDATNAGGKFSTKIYPGEVKPVFGSKLSSKGWGYSWTTGAPDAEYGNKIAAANMVAAANAIKGMRAILRAAGKSDADIDAGRISSAEMAEIAMRYDVAFVDLNFPPQQKPTLFRDHEMSEQQRHSTDICKRSIPFVKPHAFVPPMYGERKVAGDALTTALFNSRIDISALSQGALGCCYMLAAIRSLCEHPGRITSLFDFSSSAAEDKVLRSPDLGVYSMRLCIAGWWTTYVLDDFLPNVETATDLVFGENKASAELFFPLLEKCYAKAYGSYRSIVSGSAGSATNDLAGCPEDELESLEEWGKPDKLWEYLLVADREHHVINVSSPSPGEVADTKKFEESGIALGHAYSCVTVHQLSSPDAVAQCKKSGVDTRVLKISNPWASSFEWKGTFSDAWLEQPENRAIAAELNHTKADDGTYWMSFKDVFGANADGDVKTGAYFTGGYVSYFIADTHSCLRVGGSAFDDGLPNYVVELEVLPTRTRDLDIMTKKSLFVCANQRDKRGTAGEVKYEALRCTIVDQNGTIVGQNGSSYMRARDQHAHCELKPKTKYYCFILAFDGHDADGPFGFTVFASGTDVKMTVLSIGAQPLAKGRKGNHISNIQTAAFCPVSSGPVRVQMSTPAFKNDFVECELPTGNVVDFSSVVPPKRERSARLQIIADPKHTEEAYQRLMGAASGQIPEPRAANAAPARPATAVVRPPPAPTETFREQQARIAAQQAKEAAEKQALEQREYEEQQARLEAQRVAAQARLEAQQRQAAEEARRALQLEQERKRLEAEQERARLEAQQLAEAKRQLELEQARQREEATRAQQTLADEAERKTAQLRFEEQQRKASEEFLAQQKRMEAEQARQRAEAQRMMEQQQAEEKKRLEEQQVARLHQEQERLDAEKRQQMLMLEQLRQDQIKANSMISSSKNGGGGGGGSGGTVIKIHVVSAADDDDDNNNNSSVNAPFPNPLTSAAKPGAAPGNSPSSGSSEFVTELFDACRAAAAKVTKKDGEQETAEQRVKRERIEAGEGSLFKDCAIAYSCPCIATAIARSDLDGSSALVNCFCWGPGSTQHFLRKTLGIAPDLMNDVLAGCCYCCGARRVYTEARVRRAGMTPSQISTETARRDALTKSQQPWNEALFGCQMSQLLAACLCPCFLVQEMRQVFAGDGSIFFDCCCILPTAMRSEVRRRYNLEPEMAPELVEDLCIPVCCFPCALSQAVREVRVRSGFPADKRML